MSFRVTESGTCSFTAGLRTNEPLLLSVQNVALTHDLVPCVLTITCLILKEIAVSVGEFIHPRFCCPCRFFATLISLLYYGFQRVSFL